MMTDIDRITKEKESAIAEADRSEGTVLAMHDMIQSLHAENVSLRAEIERLRNDAQVAQEQVERARSILSAIDLSWLETFDRGPDADYGGIGLGDDHKTFWRDAIAFLEASGGRPEPAIIETITYEDLVRGLEPLLQHEPRCDCGHLFEICDAPNCVSALSSAQRNEAKP